MRSFIAVLGIAVFLSGYAIEGRASPLTYALIPETLSDGTNQYQLTGTITTSQIGLISPGQIVSYSWQATDGPTTFGGSGTGRDVIFSPEIMATAEALTLVTPAPLPQAAIKPEFLLDGGPGDTYLEIFCSLGPANSPSWRYSWLAQNTFFVPNTFQTVYIDALLSNPRFSSPPPDLIFATIVPEPSSLALAAFGFAGLAVWRLRRKRIALMLASICLSSAADASAVTMSWNCVDNTGCAAIPTRRRLMGKPILLFILFLAVMLPQTAVANPFSILHLFAADGLSSDTGPRGPLTVVGSTIYGTNTGGLSGGSLFSMNTDGTGFQVIHAFKDNGAAANNGYYPTGALALSGSTIYGNTAVGGIGGFGDTGGTLYSVNTDGTGFQLLHSFSGPDSTTNSAFTGVIPSGSTLYGTTGYESQGTVFTIQSDGTEFQTLHNMAPADGQTFLSAPTLSGSTMYGTTEAGGMDHLGTLYAVGIDGSGFQVLHSFSSGSPSLGGVVQEGTTLYGTTVTGGTDNLGTIFSINTDGTDFQTLYSFSGAPNDGKWPQAGVIVSGSTLYGTTAAGGLNDDGAVFQINTDGTGFTLLHSFDGQDGDSPRSILTLSGSTLYGSTDLGGPAGNSGVIFSIALPEPSTGVLAAFGFLAFAWRLRHRD